MCARCVNGWCEYFVNGEYITADFCDCNEGNTLKTEMGKMWNELELEDYPLWTEEEVNNILKHEEFLHRGE